MTYTLASLAVTRSTFKEIFDALAEAGYGPDDDLIDMSGIGLEQDLLKPSLPEEFDDLSDDALVVQTEEAIKRVNECFKALNKRKNIKVDPELRSIETNIAQLTAEFDLQED